MQFSRCTLIAILAPFLLALGCASAPAFSPAARAQERATIEGVLRAQQDAWNRGDVEAYMAAGYWQSPELVFLSGGSITRGYAPVLARYKQRYQADGREMGTLTFAETEVELLSSEIALARGRWDLAFREAKPVGGRYSLLLRRTPAGWRIVQDHSSADDR